MAVGHLNIFTRPFISQECGRKATGDGRLHRDDTALGKDPSTNPAQCCLTSVIRREPVHSAWYGRRTLKHIHKGDSG